MESLGNPLDAHEVHLNNHNVSTLPPEVSLSPFLKKVFLQENNTLSSIPPSFFRQMPILLVLDLSHTSIQSLPPSISKLYSLEELILRECSLLIQLPPEIGSLKNLKLFDLEGTEIMYLPKEIGKLKNLERLRASMSAYADEHKDRFGVEHIIPRDTISKLTKLKELTINVNPEAEWWEVELLEAILGNLCFLQDLKTLKLYLPTAKSLQQFLKLERYRVPIYSSLWNYRFMIGHCEELALSIQLDIEENFLKLEKCVKYMNGEGYSDGIMELVKNAKALYVRRHWTIENLSIFDISKVKYCLLMECNEMQTVFDQEDLYKHKHNDDKILESLQYLSVHFMKNLKSILKGPIGINSFSCLRVLALHTCPELTSVFTGYFLEDMQSLTELIIKDCPKVNCLINLEGTPWTKGPFFVNLRRVTLVDLPELVSISSGVCIAPELETLLVFNCVKLDYLSVMEIPKSTKEIKGEIEWWDALKYGKMMWHDVFVQLKRDGSLMDELKEDTNSLQHFLELETVPLHHGVSLQINQYSSRDTKEDVDSANETRKMSTEKIPHFIKDSQSKYFGTAFKMWDPQRPVRLKRQVKMSKEIKVEILVDDGHSWLKYGQKEIPGSLYPRGYYRCTFRYTHNCLARKQVQKTDEDPSVFQVIYRGQHTCNAALHSNCSSPATESTESVYTNLRTKDSPTATESVVSTFTDLDFEVPKRPQVLDTCKKKSSSVDIAKWIQLEKRSPHDSNITRTIKSKEQMKVSKGIEVEKTCDDGKIRRKYGQKSSVRIRYPIKESKGILDDEEATGTRDGYIWRKDGQKGILGSNYPRAYYKCSARGCPARKHVQRSTEDLSLVEVCYSGNHTCRSSTATESNTATESVSTITGSHFETPARLQVLDKKKSFMSGGNVRWTQLVKVSPKEWLNIPPDDGYTWNKYGKHDILGAKYSTSYYKCTSCKARKQVKRSDDDRSILEVTYEGIHTCLTLLANNYSTNTSESALKMSDSSTAIKSSLQIQKSSGSSMTAESTITDNSFGLDSGVHYLDLNQIDAGPNLDEGDLIFLESP